MEYIFGTQGDKEIIKTKGKEHTNLTGYHDLERKFVDQTITDHFLVVEKFDSNEDADGNCYDWYIIDKHYRYTDRNNRITENADSIKDTQEGLMETFELADMNSQEIADTRGAIIELYELLERGDNNGEDLRDSM